MADTERLRRHAPPPPAAPDAPVQLHPRERDPVAEREAWDQEAEAYDRHLRIRRRSPRTRETYGDTLLAFRRFLEATGRSLDPRDTGRRDVEAWLEAMADHLSPSTQRTRYVALATYYKWLASDDEEVIRANPFAKLKAPELPEVEVPVVPADAIRRLLATCTGKGFADRRDRAVILLMLSTGARRGEVAGLLLEDVDQATSRVTFQGKGERTRVGAYGDHTYEALRHYLRIRREHPQAEQRITILTGDRADHPREGRALFLVTPGHHRGILRAGGIRDMLKRRCAAAGIAPIHPHQFRHTWADGALAAGMNEGDVQRLGGWKTRDMLNRYGAHRAHERALKHYTDPVDRMLNRTHKS